MSQCDTFWNSHGCSLQTGHDGPHLCIGSYADEAWTMWDPEAFCSSPDPGVEMFALDHDRRWTIEDEAVARGVERPIQSDPETADT